MRILVNAMPLAGITTGISRYLRNLYEHLSGLPDLEIRYFKGGKVLDRLPSPPENSMQVKKTDSRRRLPDPLLFSARAARWLLYEQRLAGRLKGGFDLCHETTFTPARIKKAVPQVFTLHDLSLMNYPCFHPKERVWFSDLFFRSRLGEADSLIVPSRFIKNEVCSRLGFPGSRIAVVHEAPDPVFYPRMDQKVSAVLERLNIPSPYLLFAGTLEPRKNLSLAVEALDACSCPLHLVLAGWSGWGDKPWIQKIRSSGLSERVHITGYIDDEELACLYTGALALVYPSFYEGFGLPVLEAMACGCPVLSSSAASLPEAAGDAALYFSPEKKDELADCINLIMTDTTLQDEMSRKGLSRAAAFTWQEAAQKTKEIFIKTALSLAP